MPNAYPLVAIHHSLIAAKMKKEIATEVIFTLNGQLLDTDWMNAPDAIPNTGEWIVFPHIKGESLVEKIVHTFIDANPSEVTHRIEIRMKNDSMLQ